MATHVPPRWIFALTMIAALLTQTEAAAPTLAAIESEVQVVAITLGNHQEHEGSTFVRNCADFVSQVKALSLHELHASTVILGAATGLTTSTFTAPFRTSPSWTAMRWPLIKRQPKLWKQL